MLSIIGIDPGLGGAAVLMEGGSISWIHMSKGEGAVCEWLQYHVHKNTRVYIEKVNIMPKSMGRRSQAAPFRLGQNYGFWRGVLFTIDATFEAVPAQRWQREVGCQPPKGSSYGQRKQFLRRHAIKLFEEANIKVTHKIADALLIAEYGRRLNTTKGFGLK